MTPTSDDASDFVREILGTGLMLVDVLSMLLDELPDDAFPGEEPAEVLLEMLVGSFRPAAEAAGCDAVRQATALVGALGDRAVTDLRAAADLAAGR
ncbi:MAG: hypothetical protein ACJ77M_18145 [Thermoleophilaceae bacterium]